MPQEIDDFTIPLTHLTDMGACDLKGDTAALIDYGK